MNGQKKITACIRSGAGDLLEQAKHYNDTGADQLLIVDSSTSDQEHEQTIGTIKDINRVIDIPVIGAGNIKRLEDIKKLLYAGCSQVMLDLETEGKLLKDGSLRFGKEKMVCGFHKAAEVKSRQDDIEQYASGLYSFKETEILVDQPVHLIAGQLQPELLKSGQIAGIGAFDIREDIMAVKASSREMGIVVETLVSALAWDDFKKNSDGMVPVIVQDYRTNEVLMMAYMNEEAFENTIRTGKMTYYSRSRQELWVKGLTSGHIQYVKALTADCDRDTILAKVSQIGAACHTGNYTCFFDEIARREYQEKNPLKVFESVYDVIRDRKENPREGSYTNYLFDKGVDKILKKVGEEATEIVIAAKNPDPEEIKYEVADFLYHIMVLMVERGVTWEDITNELADR